MNSEETAIDMSGNFFVNHGPPPFMGVPDSTEGAWIVGFSRLARRFYAQYDLQQFPFDVQVICCVSQRATPLRLTKRFQSAEIVFESFAYNQDKLLWKPSAILVDTMLPKGFTVDGCKSRATPVVVLSLQRLTHVSQGQSSRKPLSPSRMSAAAPSFFCFSIFHMRLHVPVSWGDVRPVR
jgi:hypothetical protein